MQQGLRTGAWGGKIPVIHGYVQDEPTTAMNATGIALLTDYCCDFSKDIKIVTKIKPIRFFSERGYDTFFGYDRTPRLGVRYSYTADNVLTVRRLSADKNITVSEAMGDWFEIEETISRFVLNGVERVNAAQTSTEVQETHMAIFGGRNIGTINDGVNNSVTWKMREASIAYFKIYEGTELVRDFKPNKNGKLVCALTGYNCMEIPSNGGTAIYEYREED